LISLLYIIKTKISINILTILGEIYVKSKLIADSPLKK